MCIGIVHDKKCMYTWLFINFFMNILAQNKQMLWYFFSMINITEKIGDRTRKSIFGLKRHEATLDRETSYLHKPNLI